MVCVIGMIASVAAIGLAIFYWQSMWIGIMAAFAAIRCWTGFQQARLLARLENAPRHHDAACPSCEVHPLAGEYWECDECKTRFDTFMHHAVCPRCGTQFKLTACPECGRVHPFWAWYGHEGKPPEPERR